jgi:DNA-binding transcriptional regulator YdaS (Cro superfamily)
MDKLLQFLNAESKVERAAFAAACGTSEGYLRKAISTGQRLGADLCIAIERETGGQITCEDLDPKTDWAFLRATQCSPPSAAPPIAGPEVEPDRPRRNPPSPEKMLTVHAE